MPDDFVVLSDIDPSITIHIRYATNDNFLGRPVTGYKDKNKTVCTRKAALALKAAHNELKQHGYRLVVYDAYRPQRAADEFMDWRKNSNDQCMKQQYYPTIDKVDVLKKGYVADRSGHSRGSAFDLTIIELSKELTPIMYSKRTLTNGEKVPFLDDNTVDMGSSFDLFHSVSHHETSLIELTFLERRNFLRAIMKKHGFKGYSGEWWHYILKDEPYTEKYFDFVV